jgi:hypothetical protein
MLEEENDMEYMQEEEEEEEAVVGRVTRRLGREKMKGCWNRLLQSRVSWNVGQNRKQDWIGLVLID